jgi:hypothetical protein
MGSPSHKNGTPFDAFHFRTLSFSSSFLPLLFSSSVSSLPLLLPSGYFSCPQRKVGFWLPFSFGGVVVCLAGTKFAVLYQGPPATLPVVGD